MNDSFVKVNNSFISERINKVKFIEVEHQNIEPNIFISGSSEFKNNLKLWKLMPNEFADETENEFVPKAITKLTIKGDITGIEILDHNNFAVSAGSSVSLV